MKEKIMKQEKGITLIALVITIIVLLILAGVAISMLSGENGILNRVVEAKEKTEIAQKEEAGALLSYELVLNNSKYKYQYGYLTGFEYDNNENHTVETVEDLEKELQKLSSGYKVSSKYQYKDGVRGQKREIEDVNIDDKTIHISTGMAITKDGEEVARTVLFGDINFDGIINGVDLNLINYYISFNEKKLYRETKECQKVAMNIDNDKEINFSDLNIVMQCVANGKPEINQNNKISGEKSKRMRKDIQEYIELLDENTGYSFEYNEEEDTYKLKGVKKGTTVNELVDKLPNSDKVKIMYMETIKPETTSKEMLDEEELIDNCYVQIEFKYVNWKGNDQSVNPSFAHIELE